MTNAPLRIGVLGAARITDMAVIQPAHNIGAELVAVAARSKARGEAFAAQHGFAKVHDSYEALLADPDIDVVYNPLPNAFHGPWNIRALRAGKHVLAEKPSASNAAEAREVAAVVDETGLVFMEAFHHAYHPVYLRMLEVIASGEIGDVRDVDAMFVMPDPGVDDLRTSWELAGGAMMDIGVYSLHAVRSIARVMGGEPRLTAAMTAEYAPGVDAELAARFLLPNGASAIARCDMLALGSAGYEGAAGGYDEYHSEVRVLGTEGRILVPSFVRPHVDGSLTITVGGETRTEDLGTRSSYTYQLEALTRAIREGAATNITDHQEAVRHMEFIDECYIASGMTPRQSITN
jgi:predicted dehydrogenase